MDYLGKEEMLTNRDGHFWDIFFQLMKHGTNTLHAEFIFLFSVYLMCIRDNGTGTHCSKIRMEYPGYVWG